MFQTFNLNMKSLYNLSIVFLVLISITFSSCGDDDENGNNNTSIVGTWVLIRYIDTNCSEPDDNGEQSVTCDDNDCTTFIFNEDDTFQAIEIEDGMTLNNSTGTYSINGNLLTLTGVLSGFPINVAFEFSISDDLLTIVDNSADLDCTITSILQRQ